MSTYQPSRHHNIKILNKIKVLQVARNHLNGTCTCTCTCTTNWSSSPRSVSDPLHGRDKSKITAGRSVGQAADAGTTIARRLPATSELTWFLS